MPLLVVEGWQHPPGSVSRFLDGIPSARLGWAV